MGKRLNKYTRAGIVWGVIIGVLVTALYETIKSLLRGQFQDAAYSGVAAAIALIIVILPARHLLQDADHTGEAF